jgi:hypothetical protein
MFQPIMRESPEQGFGSRLSTAFREWRCRPINSPNEQDCPFNEGFILPEAVATKQSCNRMKSFLKQFSTSTQHCGNGAWLTIRAEAADER